MESFTPIAGRRLISGPCLLYVSSRGSYRRSGSWSWQPPHGWRRQASGLAPFGVPFMQSIPSTTIHHPSAPCLGPKASPGTGGLLPAPGHAVTQHFCFDRPPGAPPNGFLVESDQVRETFIRLSKTRIYGERLTPAPLVFGSVGLSVASPK